MLAGEVDAALGLRDRAVELALLAGVEERERAAGPAVLVPRVGRAALVDVADPRVDLRHVLERLLEARLLVHRAPARRVLAPGVRGQQHAARGGLARRRIV